MTVTITKSFEIDHGEIDHRKGLEEPAHARVYAARFRMSLEYQYIRNIAPFRQKSAICVKQNGVEVQLTKKITTFW